jgi:hypothetical protein
MSGSVMIKGKKEKLLQWDPLLGGGGVGIFNTK